MLGVTQQTYARLEANPSKASFERLYKVLNIIGIFPGNPTPQLIPGLYTAMGP